MRRLERKWRRSSLTVHHQINTGLRNTLRKTPEKTPEKTRSQHYTSVIMEASGRMRWVCKISYTLLGRDGDRPLHEGTDARHSALATRFQTSTFEKIDAPLCNLLWQLVDGVSPNVIVPLVGFEAASPPDVKRIVLTSAAKSFELDPLTSSLLKRHVDALSLVLARIINASLCHPL